MNEKQIIIELEFVNTTIKQVKSYLSNISIFNNGTYISYDTNIKYISSKKYST